MAERTHIPGTPACGEWETLLADALDGLLKSADEAQFLAHKAACPACAALYEEARKGREWLEFLAPEPEPPAGLLEKILATTGPGHPASTVSAPAGPNVVPAFVPPVWQQPGFLARMRSAVQPRLLMTAAMAFFSIALTLNLAGVRLSNIDLRPSAVRSYMERQLTMASVPIVRYYDHLRFVYEVEARMRELRGQDEGEGNGGEQQQKQTQPVTPGETRQNPGQIRNRGTEGTREQATPAGTDRPLGTPAGNKGTRERRIADGSATDGFLETSLTIPMSPRRNFRSAAHETGIAERGCDPSRLAPLTPLMPLAPLLERSTPWIA